MKVTSDGWSVFVRRMEAMLTLPESILAQIDQANADKEAAAGADSVDQDNGVQLAAAQERKNQSAAASVEAHRTALSSANTLIDELIDFFQATPRGNTNTPPTGGDQGAVSPPDQPMGMARDQTRAAARRSGRGGAYAPTRRW